MAVKVTVYGTADMRQIDRARAQLDALERKAMVSAGGFTGAMAKISQATGRVGTAMVNVGSSMTRNVTLPLLAVGAGLYKATEAAAKDAQAQTILATTMRNTAGATDATIASTERWITAQGKALGVADDQLRPALATLVTATQDVGKAQTLAGVAMDLAAAKGIPVEAAAKAIAKAYSGQTTALGRLVPGLDKAALKSGNFGAVVKSLNEIVGGQAAKAANTEAGARQRATVALSEAVEELGTSFLPIMTQVTNFITNQVVPAIIKLSNWWKNLDGNTKTVILTVAGVLAALGPTITIIGKVVLAVRALSTALMFLSANPVGMTILAIGALVAVIVLVATHTKQIGAFFSAAWTKAKTIVSDAVGAIGKWLKGLATSMVNVGKDMVQGLINGLKDLGARLLEAVSKPVTDAVNWIKNKLGIQSPSKVTHEIGANFTQGFIDGITSKKADAANAASDVANAAAAALYNVDRQTVVSKLSDSGLLKTAESMGVDLKQLTDAVLGDNNAKKAVDKAIDAWYAAQPNKTYKKRVLGDTFIELPNISLAVPMNKVRRGIADLRKEFKTLGSENDRQKKALGLDVFDTVIPEIDQKSKELAAKIKKAGDLARDAMRTWNMDELVSPITASFEKVLGAIQSQVSAMANFMNNLATLKSKGLAAGALAALLSMGAAQGGAVAASLASGSASQIAQYNTAYKEQERLAGILGRQQAGLEKIAPVTVAPGAIQVSIAGNADQGQVTDAMKQAIDALVRELRSR